MKLHRCTKLHATITIKHCEAMRARSGWTATGTLSQPPQCRDCEDWKAWDESNEVALTPIIKKENVMPKSKKSITEEAIAQYEAALTRIKEATKCKTQTQLAEFLDVRQSSISDSKRRASIPSDWLIKIWRKTTLSPDWILYGDASGQRYAVPSDSSGQAFNAVTERQRIEAEVREELDNLHLEDLIKRVQDFHPGAQVVFPARAEA